MSKISAGLLCYRRKLDKLEFLLGFPGGPFWSPKIDDPGQWTIPKGEVDPDETDLFKTALREFQEETGLKPKSESFYYLDNVVTNSGKIIYAWAFEQDFNIDNFICPSRCLIEYPPCTKQICDIPELEDIKYFEEQEAIRRINTNQLVFIEKLKKGLEL